MNPLDMLLRALFNQAQPRPDLGSSQPVATFAGRVVTPGDTTTSALSRMPMGSGEGDLGGALQATVAQAALPAMSAASKALAPKLLAMMVPGARVYHGTPLAYQAVDMNKAGAMIDSPSHFVTTSPQLASEYALGGLSEARNMIGKGNYAPNVRPYKMQEHNSLVTDQPIPQADLIAVLKAIRPDLFQPKTTKHGVVSPERQAQNLAAQVESSVLPEVSPGQHLRDVLYSNLGVAGGEALLRKAGFKSIQYPGEQAGSLPQQATKVIDPSILANLLDALNPRVDSPRP